MDAQSERELQILEYLEFNPDMTQADLATRLGVAVGSVNWYLKRLVNKGYVKVRKMQRRRLRYLITPQGVAQKMRLTQAYMQASLQLYRETRAEAQRLLAQVAEAGYESVQIEGDGDLAEIVYLSCLEAHLKVRDDLDPAYPVFKIDGFKTVLDWPEGEKNSVEPLSEASG